MSRVIFKLTYKHPNFKDTKPKNIAHVKYIAMRSGVDKTITEKDLQRELQKGIEKIESEDEIYLKYIGERPRSHGLFGTDGIEDLKTVTKEIQDCESFIWRGVISLKEEDAKRLGYLEKEKWQDLLRKKMPDVASEMGIKVSNFRWVAAIHMEKGHPHAHIMFWEKTPERTLGVVSSKCLDNIRKSLTDEIFEEERFQLLNEKNAMRDLIRDLAKNNVGEASKIIKEVRSNGVELRSIIQEMCQEGIPPRLYSEEETELSLRIQKLSQMLPGKGRAMLKFMPQDVKDEVRAIADYILEKPDFAASLEKNLKAVEELTKLYTGKEEAIQKARDKAYNDIRDRVSQLILRGAVESLRDNLLYVDGELASNFVSFMKNLNTQINLIPERHKVINQMCTVMIRTGHDDNVIRKVVSDFCERENLGFDKEEISQFIKDNKAMPLEQNIFSSNKKIDFMLSILKTAGYSEKESFSILNDSISQDSTELERHLNELCKNGYLELKNDAYTMTEKGLEEFLTVKDLDSQQKSILKLLENGEKSFSEIISDKEVFSRTIDKDPAEFKISKFDLKVREEFGEDNRITLKELEESVYGKYTGTEEIDKADRELDILKNRIDKLYVNGYVNLDKQTGVYSFTQEGIDELTKLKDRMEFTRYDANVTLSYIDKAENGSLHSDVLRNMLHQDIVNQRAKLYFERFNDLLESDGAKEYVSVDDGGYITATKQGKELSFQLQKVLKYFNDAKGYLTDEKLKDICQKEFKSNNPKASEEKYKEVVSYINQQIEKGNIIHQNDGAYIIDPVKKDVKDLLYQVHKEGGSILKDELKEVLEKNIPNKEAERQYNYIIKRLDNLKKQDYIEGGEKEYRLTEKGYEKRQDLLTPQREILRKELNYLKGLGLIQQTDNGYTITEGYQKYMKELAKVKKSNILRHSKIFKNEVVKLIDKSYNQLRVNKIMRINQRLAAGKYINGGFSTLPLDYNGLRDFCHVDNTIQKTIQKLSTALLVSGVSHESVKQILHEWNLRSASNIEPDKINEIIEKSNSVVEDDRLFGRLTVISKSEWEEIFKDLGVKDQPAWIYKGLNWKEFNLNGMGLYSIVNDVWKSTWRTMEQQRLQTEAQAELLKKNAVKQQATENKSAKAEQIRKTKDKGSLQDDELDR